MRKRITLLVVALMMALTMALGAAGAAFAASPLAEECMAKGGTWDSATKTCSYPVGKSGKHKTATFHDAGNGDQISRTNPNGKTLPS